MKIAIAGTRGVPPQYGGFETFAAELGWRLVDRGHEITIYSRGPKEPRKWRGIRRLSLPAVPHKYLETVSHAFVSAMHALGAHYDAVLLCNAANAFTIPLFRVRRVPVAINVDGIERRRRKWNALGRMVYAAGEALSVSFADRVVADAQVIGDYYRKRFTIDPIVIPYGSEFPEEPDTDVLTRLGVRAREYVLYVSRFEPENNPIEVADAYAKLSDAPPLLMVGSGLYAKGLVRALQKRASPRIRFPGAIYGADYRTLQRNALIYVQATEVGGTHPAMIEAMGSGGAVLAHDTPENLEVGGEAVGYFHLRPAETLSLAIRDWLMHPHKAEEMRARARRRASERYSWEKVADAYEALFQSL